jgi:hypothetical protein
MDDLDGLAEDAALALMSAAAMSAPFSSWCRRQRLAPDNSMTSISLTLSCACAGVWLSARRARRP